MTGPAKNVLSSIGESATITKPEYGVALQGAAPSAGRATILMI